MRCSSWDRPRISRSIRSRPLADGGSKALRDHSDIGKETKARALKRTAELNYRMDWVARGVKTGRTYLVGLVTPDVVGEQTVALLLAAMTAKKPSPPRQLIVPRRDCLGRISVIDTHDPMQPAGT